MSRIKHTKGRKPVFVDKITLAKRMIIQESTFLRSNNVPKKRIWILNDSWYTSKTYCDDIRNLGHYFVCGLKSNRNIRLFDKWMRVDKYFKKYQTESYFTTKDENKRVYYKQATLDISKIGRCKVFAFKTTDTDKYKYYICNKLDISAKNVYEHKKQRWSVETQHRTLKQYFGLESCYSGKKETMIGHTQLSYFLYWIFSVYMMKLAERGIKTTIEMLWHEYIVESNFIQYNGKNYNMIDSIMPKMAIS